MKILSRRRSRIHAKVPFPNDNRTFSCGTKILVESVFSDTGLNDFLDGLKRDQGERVSNEVVALVANSVEMTGISVNRLDRMLSDDSIRKEYGLGNAHETNNLVERVHEGKNVRIKATELGLMVVNWLC